MKYWLGIVSKEHVLKGIEDGFAQVCHKKKNATDADAGWRLANLLFAWSKNGQI